MKALLVAGIISPRTAFANGGGTRRMCCDTGCCPDDVAPLVPGKYEACWELGKGEEAG